MAATPQQLRPTEQDFTPRAVTRAVRNEAVQHPATILPMAGALGFGFWNVVVGLSLGGLAGMLGLAFIGGVSCAYQYLIRGETHAKHYVDERLALRRQYEAQDVEDLAGDCRRAGFDDGVRHVTALRDAYDAFYEGMRERDDATTVGHLGRDAFHEGVAAVRRALEVYEARSGMDVARLVRERDRLQHRERSGAPDASTDRVAAREIAANAQLIDRHREMGELADELLARATEIETALETARLDFAARAGREMALADRGSGTQLATALEAARRVQARAFAGERGDAKADAEYLQAGRRERTEKEGTHGG
jgi:hypothetical protein